MKVLHVIPSISPLLGGPSRVVLELVRSLRGQGVEAEIVTTNDHGPDLLDVPLAQRIEYEQVPIWFFSPLSPRLKEFIISPGLTRWLWQNLRNYDLVESHYLFSYAPTCAGIIARRQRIPYTVRTMGQLTSWALAQSQLKKQIYTALIERHNLNCAAAIHCTSEGEAQDVRRLGIRSPTITVPLGVDPTQPIPEAKQQLRQRYGIDQQTPIVLFLSRLHHKKRPDLLLQALAQLAQKNYDFHLILAGSGETSYLEYLEKMVRELDLVKRTTLPGFVAGPEKDLVLQGSDLFVLPSFSENFGVAIAEAMSAGLPVIVTPGIQISPAIAEAEAGLVVDGNLEQLVPALAQLLSSAALREKLGENGKQLVQNEYSWQTIAHDLAEIYTKIVEKRFTPT
ncbi:glycosyltransferase [Leptolyngbya sp. FACHB-261]|uniref:glycosyltransferase n=1 Tax=Leptolyngbya sp. FACHB-261 TaxID=2692806 RepID=UPI001687420D|nr:glycosyltransferase [Leptolyngbya sp. FACHB-261]MBD2099616.1 glycosyltransferase [Leptolyngbya sp. FACHB-261]